MLIPRFASALVVLCCVSGLAINGCSSSSPNDGGGGGAGGASVKPGKGPGSGGAGGAKSEPSTPPPPPDPAPPALPAYPDEPWGFTGATSSKPGDVFPNLKFKGYHDATGEWVDISMNDYYDPDGTRGINAIYFVVSAEWCPPCKAEAKMLAKVWETDYKPRGARFITAVVQNNSRKDADQATVDRWIAAHGLNFDAVQSTMQEVFSRTTREVSFPTNYVINPRDMRLYKVVKGMNPKATKVPDVDYILNANGAPPAK